MSKQDWSVGKIIAAVGGSWAAILLVSFFAALLAFVFSLILCCGGMGIILGGGQSNLK